MQLEKELKDKIPFRSQYSKTIVNIVYSANWVEERFNEYLKPEQITWQQFNALRILERAKQTMSTKDLKALMVDKNSDASRLIDRLVLKGLVIKKASEQDLRKIVITLSDSGTFLLKRLEARFQEMEAIVGNLSDDESVSLNNLLDKMRG